MKINIPNPNGSLAAYHFHIPQSIWKVISKKPVARNLNLVTTFQQFTANLVRSFAGMDRNGPNYRNGLPE